MFNQFKHVIYNDTFLYSSYTANGCIYNRVKKDTKQVHFPPNMFYNSNQMSATHLMTNICLRLLVERHEYKEIDLFNDVGLWKRWKLEN